MGIPLYFKIITDKYPNIIKPKIDNEFKNNLFLDLNCAIHPCAHKILENYNSSTNNTNSIEQKIINEVIHYIYKLISMTNPELLYIAIDGVAPCAKMNQQRKRRYKSIYDKQVIGDIKEKLNIEDTKFNWDTNAISPGTKFMKKLSKSIEFNLRNNFKTMKIYFSDSEVHGEGEHKILDYIRNNTIIGNTIIYGLDADLMMLSMVSNKEQIYLLREGVQFGKVIENSFLYLDIDYLKFFLYADLKEQILMYDSTYIFKENEKTLLINDYIFISFLIGNDFLPHLPSYNLRSDGLFLLLEKYISIYVNFGTSLIDNTRKKINNQVLSALLRKISENEDNLLVKYNTKRKKFRFRTFKDTEYQRQLDLLNNKPIIERIGEDYIDIGNTSNNWKSKYYDKCLNINDSEDLDGCILNYLTGLKWTYEYYFIGCSNYTWKYNYRHSPSSIDISNYLNKIDINDIKIKNTKPYSSIVQLLTILPKNSIYLIDSKFKFIMNDSDIIDYYPESFDLDSYYKRYYWECEPILPLIDYNRVKQCIKTSKLNNYEKTNFSEGTIIEIN